MDATILRNLAGIITLLDDVEGGRPPTASI
jgi:hypothetical protein